MAALTALYQHQAHTAFTAHRPQYLDKIDAAMKVPRAARRRDVPKRVDVLMFSGACAAILHCYSDGRGRHRDVFRSKYLNILDFVFGGSGARAAVIPCAAPY